MDNPWLKIPLEEYERHMSDPAVEQAGFLSEQFSKALSNWNPESVLFAGCAGGNGLQCIVPAHTGKLTAVDINPEYLAVAKERFNSILPFARWVCGDLNSLDLGEEEYTLIYAGLVLEYLNPAKVLTKFSRSLKTDGALVCVLQQQGTEKSGITVTQYSTLQQIAPLMQLYRPDEISRLAEKNGMGCVGVREYTLFTGKRFAVAVYQKN